MLQFDEKNKRVYAYINELARPSLEVSDEPNNIYKSFRQYVENRAREDVMEIFMPALLKAINDGPDAIATNRGRISIHTVNDDYHNDKSHHVGVRFELPKHNNESAEEVSIIRIPTVYEDGTIEWESKKYSFIHMLEQEPTISFEENEATDNPQSLKIKNGTRSIWIDDNSKMLKIRLSDRAGASSKTKYCLIDLIVEYALTEGYDPFEIWSEFANFQIINMFKDAEERDLHLVWRGANQASVNAEDYGSELIPRLTLTRERHDKTVDTSYDNSAIREELNRLLSLDRAIGEILAKDVESILNPGKIIATAGTVIDSYLIDQFNAEGVYRIYVKKIPNIEGYYLDDDIIINYAPNGLKISDELREYFPEEKGMYTSRFYRKMDHPIIYGEGEPLTASMIETIVAFGLETISIRTKPKGGTKKILNFFEEIISNRQFLGQWIGKTNEVDAREWWYMDKGHNFKRVNGSYTAYDFVALQSFCVKLFEGKWIERVTNADSGFRKVLVPIEEQYHRAFAFAVRETFKQMNRKLKTVYKTEPQKYLIADQINNEFWPFAKNFFKYLRDEAKCLIALTGDNVHNPVSYISACTKANVFTKSKHSIAASQREIAIGSYGKIDPYEIPQSQKMGTVYNTCCGTVIGLDGKMFTKYYEVKHMGGISRIVTDNVVLKTSAQEECEIIADICSLQADERGIIQDNSRHVLCRVPSNNSIEKQTFAVRPISDVTLVNVDATQPCSYPTSTIPFMNSNDAARAIFAVAQEKQAKGLVWSEEPDVITSAYEQIPKMNNKFCLIAKDFGYVDSITYKAKDKVYVVWVVYGKRNTSQDGFMVFDASMPNRERYEFPEFIDSGYSVTKIRPLLKNGDNFEKGDVIIGSNFVSDRGVMSIGINALVAYHCDGFNYEDGAHISQALSDRMTSYKVHKEEFSGSQRHTKSYNIAIPPSTAFVSSEIGSSFDVTFKDGDNMFADSKTRYFEDNYGFVHDFEPMKAEHRTGNYGLISRTISVDKFSNGDKSSNRHGNKGVASVIEPTANMPRLLNGMPIEVCLNPLGVATRRNIGQIKEVLSGLFAHVLKFQLSADAYNSISDDEINAFMSLTVDLMNSTGDPMPVINQHMNWIGQMKNYDAFIRHLCSVINDIRLYAGCFDKSGTTRLILPTNDGKLTETKVLIGYIHMFKLIQESSSKIHARGGLAVGEPYTELGDDPTKGSSKGGGQRFGTMEMDAICAYGASAYIQELTNERCDNAIARDNLHIETYMPKSLQKKYHIERPGQKRAVTQLLYSLLALGIMTEPENGEFIPLDKDNGTQLAHWKPSVLQKASNSYSKNTGDSESTNSEESVDTEPVIVEGTSARDLILGASN